MSLFEHDGDDQEMKDKLLLELIEKMEAVLGDGLKQRHGMGVEIEAGSPEGLKEGIEKAGDVLDKGQGEPPKSDGEQHASDESDLARLAELADEDDEDDKFKK